MKALAEQIGDIDGVNIYGRVVGVRGLMVEIAGPIHAMSVGARIVIDTGGNRFIPAEVIGFSGSNAVVMPFDHAIGDMALAGAPLIGRFEGARSGHGLNNALLRKLFSDPRNYEKLTLPGTPTPHV